MHHPGASVPRWFLAVLAVCAVILTGALAYRILLLPVTGRWEWVHGDSTTAPGVFDRSTGEFCALVDDRTFTCFDRRAHRTTIEHLDMFTVRSH